MKKLFATVLVAGMMLFTSASAFAAEPAAPFVCPNGNAACISSGECLYPENCPNGGVPKRDGTGMRRGGGHGRGGQGCAGQGRGCMVTNAG